MNYIERIDIERVKYLDTLTFEDFISLIHKDEDSEIKIRTKAQREGEFNYFKKFCKEVIKSGGINNRVYSQIDGRGRFYCVDSIQMKPSSVRGFLMEGVGTDIDMVNCHPTLLLYICKQHGIICPNLQYYVSNREDLVKNDPNIKISVISYINGSAMKPYSKFTKDFSKEIKEITSQLLNIDKYKNILENIDKTKTNKIGTACFRIMEDMEVQVITEVIEYLNTKDIEVAVLMHDGVLVYGDFYDDSELLCELSKVCEEKFHGIGMRFSYKRHSDRIKMPINFDYEKESLSEFETKYQDWKKNWEQNVFSLVVRKSITHDLYEDPYMQEVDFNSPFVFNHDNNFIDMTNEKINNGKKDVYCLDIWKKDSKKREYFDLLFAPPPFQVSQGLKYYNTWKNYTLENYETVDKKIDVEHCVKVFTDYMFHMSKENSSVFDYLIQYLSHMAQFPGEKPGVSPVFIGDSGTGKGTFAEIMNSLFGNENIFNTSDIKTVLGQFTSNISKKLILILDEAVSKEMFEKDGPLKYLITEPKTKIERKGKDAYNENSFCRVFIFSNSENVVKISNSDRRMMVVSPKIYVKPEYDNFPSNIFELIRSKDCCKIVFDYLKTVDVKYRNIQEWQSNRPKTEDYEEMRQHNIPTIIKFLTFYIRTKCPEQPSIEVSQKVLYDNFAEYAGDNDKYRLNRDTFNKRMTKFESITRRRSQSSGDSVVFYCINKMNFLEEMRKTNQHINEDCI